MNELENNGTLAHQSAKKLVKIQEKASPKTCILCGSTKLKIKHHSIQRGAYPDWDFDIITCKECKSKWRENT